MPIRLMENFRAIFYAPYYATHALGFYKREGLDVEVRALVDLVYPLAWSGRDRALEAIDRALQLGDAQPDPLVRARTRARCMVRRIQARGWDAEDAAESERALAEIRRVGTAQDVAWHLIDSGFLALSSSHYRQAQRDMVGSLNLLRERQNENIPLGYFAAHRHCECMVPLSLTFLGEWGAALRESDAAIALAERNADRQGHAILRLYRCFTQLCAMDFAGAGSVCASILAAPQRPVQPYGWHLCLALSGAAEAPNPAVKSTPFVHGRATETWAPIPCESRRARAVRRHAGESNRPTPFSISFLAAAT